jgi:hypothetical protein
MAVKVKQFLNNIKDLAIRRAVMAILQQLQLDLAANKLSFNDHSHGRVLGPAPVFATKATADPDIKTTTTFFYVKSDGTIQSKTAGNIDVSAVTGYVPTSLAAGKQRIYLITVNDADGAYGVTEGVDHATAAVRPATPAGKIAVGYCKCVNTTNPFTFGTTNSDAAGVTLTYADLCEIGQTDLTALSTAAFVNNVEP